MTGKLYGAPEKVNMELKHGTQCWVPGCNFPGFDFCFFWGGKKSYLYHQGWQSGIALRYTSSQVFHLVFWQDELLGETRGELFQQVKKKSGLRFWAVGATIRCTIKQTGKGSQVRIGQQKVLKMEIYGSLE